MKKFYAILCLTIASLTQLQAQAPQGFNYQATVRNSSGDLIVNTNVYFKFNVIQGSQTAVPIFTETHYVPTDDLGQVNLVIGQGTANTGTFSELDWSLGSYYLGIELNTGNGYVAMGTTQLLSVPYALYAENSGNSTPTTPNLEAVLAENNSANNQQIKDLQDPTDGQDAVTKAYVDTEVLNNVQNIEQVLTQGNDANGLQLKGIADPTEAQDAVTKAYFENNTTSSGLTPGNTLGDMLYWDGENWTQINAPENNGTLRFCDGQLTWGACKAEIRIFDIYDGYAIRYLIETNGSDVYDIRAYISQENLVPDENDTVILGWPDDEGYYMYKTQEELYLNTSLITNTNYYIRLRVESNLGISYSDVVQYTYTGLDVDNDNDGYSENQGDCDDTNAQINPGATEIEDGIDNDCDGEIDEGFNELLTLPVITTNEQIEIFSAYANSGGNITSDGGAEVTERGVVWGTSPNPTINLETKTQNGGGTGNFSSYVYGLSLGVEYYLRAYATNSVGTAYGDEIVFETSYAIGQQGPAGGLIFYDKGFYSDGWRYLEANQTDFSFGGVVWWNGTWNYQNEIGISPNSNLGDGKANTLLIIEANNNLNNAAKVCNDFVYNGYSDWYLPSIGELELMCQNLYSEGIGNFADSFYWSSTDTNKIRNAHWIQFSSSPDNCVVRTDLGRNMENLVRPIRQF